MLAATQWQAWQAAAENAAQACHAYAMRHAGDNDNTMAQAWMMLQCAAEIRA